jgi:hypothetical protein
MLAGDAFWVAYEAVHTEIDQQHRICTRLNIETTCPHCTAPRPCPPWTVPAPRTIITERGNCSAINRAADNTQARGLMGVLHPPEMTTRWNARTLECCAPIRTVLNGRMTLWMLRGDSQWNTYMKVRNLIEGTLHHCQFRPQIRLLIPQLVVLASSTLNWIRTRCELFS